MRRSLRTFAALAAVRLCGAHTRRLYYDLWAFGFGLWFWAFGFGGFGFGHKHILKVLFVETLPRKALSNQWAVMKDLSMAFKRPFKGQKPLKQSP